MIHNRLLHRVEPYPDESLTGFLMRVALKNHLLGPDEILFRIRRDRSRNIHMQYIEELAYFCRNSLDEIQHLDGIEKWQHGEPRWQIGKEWITRSVFIDNRGAKVCPICLRESSYLRGIWSLSLYNVCAQHGVALIERCLKCGRLLKWNRKRPEYCGCGQHLASLHEIPDNSAAVNLARLLAYRSGGDTTLLSNIPLSTGVIERLVNLSLDGMCKTVWFLGHCLSEVGAYGTGHGRKKPASITVTHMAEKTFGYLSEWPNILGFSIGKLLLERLNVGFTAVDCHRVLAPADHYFNTSLDQPELRFLTKSYEQYVQAIWLAYGRRHPACIYEQQLRLPF